eukprot:scaffold63345_cov76-Phaeocystis_antarctica.AAC.2
MAAPSPVQMTNVDAHTTRIARASVGKRARGRRQAPIGYGTSHNKVSPTVAAIDWPAASMIAGVTQIADIAHPACPMAKLTRSRRLAADSRAARNTPLTAAELAAPEGVLRAVAVADSEDEVAAPCAPTLGSAFTPRCNNRRQPETPRSSKVGKKATATGVVKVATTTSVSTIVAVCNSQTWKSENVGEFSFITRY